MKAVSRPDPNDPGLLDASEVSLLCDLYELTMAASYHREGLDRPAVFELFARHLPPHRSWLIAAGIGPALRLVSEMRFGEAELGYLRELGFEPGFLDYLADFRFQRRHRCDAGGVALLRRRAAACGSPGRESRRSCWRRCCSTRSTSRPWLPPRRRGWFWRPAGGEPGHGERVIDFSPRRDHGIDAAMKVARCAAIAGCAGTSNVAAAQRYGLAAMGTMAHSYVLSFRAELEAFRAFLRAFPERGVLLVDTYDVAEGVRTAIAAARQTGTELRGVRIDSGDLESHARRARELLDEAGMTETEIIVSGDLEEVRIAELVASGAPIDRFGVGTDLGTSRDSPVVNGVYKLVADADPDGGWRGVRKLSADKETLPGPKQVFRRSRDGKLRRGPGRRGQTKRSRASRCWFRSWRAARSSRTESMEQMRARADASLRSLPEHLRHPEPAGSEYPVEISERLRSSAAS